jgi:hypothetical protein
MKNAVMLSLACALAGCSTANFHGQAGTLQVGPSVSGGSAGINVQGGSALGAIAGIATIAALIGAWRDAPPLRDLPAMLEDRAINEVDCTQPIADWSKNLKCK